ncbi:MAG: M6 family metalloprotease domain-containing protein [Paludibacteraceae bacterium]|nr:M6 family metalloprotease domain-containing protein [Paludibacteraceae bacterium]
MKRILGIVVLCAVAVSAAAIPARRGGVVRTATDGTEKIVFLNGDENFHYLTDAEGNWLDEETLMPMAAEAKAARLQARESAARIRRAPQQTQAGSVLNIAPRGLIILVSFQDKAFSTPYETMHEMLNGDNFSRTYDYDFTYRGERYQGTITASGSARQYFIDQSWGQYQPQFDVVGPVTVSQNLSYYGQNDSNGDDKNVDVMIREACKAVDDQVDFKQYDNDGDGKVDFVYFIYAGYGEADGGPANTIWPHNYDYQYYVQYGSSQLTVDGKKISNYACSNEIQYNGGNYAGIGTFCHEFSHVLGLPDFYYTANGTSPHTLNEWDIMDYGPYNNDGNTPPAYSSYERFFMGWLTPRVLTENDADNSVLHVLNDTQDAILLCSGEGHNLVGTNPDPSTFYMLEARKQEGWDLYLPGQGMMITKITYSTSKWDGNTVNNSAKSMGVDIIEAKTNTSEYGAATDLFPAGAKQWYGYDGHDIEKITRLPDGTITFIYNGGWPEGIEDVQDAEMSTQKVLRNGHLFILRDGKTYDVMGRMITSL